MSTHMSMCTSPVYESRTCSACSLAACTGERPYESVPCAPMRASPVRVPHARAPTRTRTHARVEPVHESPSDLVRLLEIISVVPHDRCWEIRAP